VLDLNPPGNDGAASTSFLTRAELAGRWRTSPGRLANLASAGVGPAYVKLGARVLYPLAAVETHEAENLVQPARTAA
jgi:hypothetical protein